jgi:glycosyltransferase involved in cell wall biosynthesis
VTLKKSDTFKNVIPSKIFENAAMEIPVLLGVDGEIRELIQQYDAGLYFEPENESEFLEAIQRIRLKHNYEAFKIGARKLAGDFNRKMLAQRMYHEIHKGGLQNVQKNSGSEIKINQT